MLTSNPPNPPDHQIRMTAAHEATKNDSAAREAMTITRIRHGDTAIPHAGAMPAWVQGQRQRMVVGLVPMAHGKHADK